jgi:general secretion pathway protein E
VLVDVATRGNAALCEQVISRIKVMSELDIAERRVPQDGRFRLALKGRPIDFRVSVMPSAHGEDAVLRILDKQALTDELKGLRLDALGFEAEVVARLRRLSELPYGMLLVTGPTGSGKTTTLYSCLSRINDGATKILTVEDPVEIRMPSIQQIQVNEKAEVTFARSVRAFLRQDPDVILVGEVRDEETAREAFRAANTGHLVLTTLHANTAVEALGRLFDLDMDPYQVSTTLLGSLAQRLLRKLCPNCKKRSSLNPALLFPELAENVFGAGRVPTKPFEVWEAGKGCSQCSGGHSGRTVVAEVLALDAELREAIYTRASNEKLVQTARKRGFRTMMDNALWLVVKGIVSLQEAEATCGPMTTAPAKPAEKPSEVRR